MLFIEKISAFQNEVSVKDGYNSQTLSNDIADKSANGRKQIIFARAI